MAGPDKHTDIDKLLAEADQMLAGAGASPVRSVVRARFAHGRSLEGRLRDECHEARRQARWISSATAAYICASSSVKYRHG